MDMGFWGYLLYAGQGDVASVPYADSWNRSQGNGTRMASFLAYMLFLLTNSAGEEPLHASVLMANGWQLAVLI